MGNPQASRPKYQEPKKAYLLDEAQVAARRTAEAKEAAADGKPARRALRNRRALRRIKFFVAGFLALLVVAGVIVVLLLPGWIKAKAIKDAAAHGVALSIEDVSLGMSHVTLKGIHVTSADLPGVTMTAVETDVALSGFSPEVVTVKSPEVIIDGEASALGAVYSKWREEQGLAKERPPVSKFPKIIIDQAHLVWDKASEGQTIEANAVHLEVTDEGGHPAIQFVAPRISVKTPHGKIGDWRWSYDSNGTTARVRVAFDPEVPEGANASLVIEKGQLAQADLDIPRTPFTRLRLPPELFGLPSGDATQIEAKVHYARSVPNAVEATAKIGVYGMRFPSMKQVPIDGVLEAEARGKVNETISVTKGDVTVGRIRGSLTGTVKVSDGVHLDLTWKPPAVACQAFVTPMPPAPGTDPAGEMIHGLQSFVQSLGKVEGSIQLGAHLVFDTHDIQHAKIDPELHQNCSWSLFGH